MYPKAHILGCSTSGEICGTRVSDNSLVVTAVNFEFSQFNGTQVNLDEVDGSSYEAGVCLARSLDQNDLMHVFLLSDGLNVNGSDLARGLVAQLPDNVKVTGGLAGDSDRFEETVVVWDEALRPKTIAALGLYGKRLRIGYGSLGGWDPFGPERLVTRSRGNVLYELDGRSALDLYKEYLGEHSSGLPATGLLFPLNLRHEETKTAVVRTILSIDEVEQSMTFAGDIPRGSYTRLMKANFDRLIDGAIGAAQQCIDSTDAVSPQLAILISCVGRKQVLKQRTEEEVEGVRDILGEQAVLTGFYSYGELCPVAQGAECELHNQTMTITTFSEA